MNCDTAVEIIQAINKEVYARMDGEELDQAETAVALLLEVREAHDQLEQAMKMLGSLLKLLREAKVPELFKERGVTSISVNGNRFTHTQTLRASIRDGLKPEAFKWLRANGLGEIITETVNSNTLAAQARDLKENGEVLPEDWFNTYEQSNISITRTK